MKKFFLKTHQLAVAALLMLFSFSCEKNMNNSSSSSRENSASAPSPKEFKDFVQVNLVGDNNAYSPANIDANLVNAWGLDFPATGNIRVVAEGTGMGTVYTLDGNIAAAAISIP